MVATNGRTVTVFGGTGFLGHRIVRHLRYRGFAVRIASRHPDRGHRLFGPDDPQLQSVEANIHDERSVADGLAGAYGVVNAVSLYDEHGQETFHSVHVEAAQRVAAQAHLAGVERLIHVSGIGADAASPSRYIRKRGEGELAVRAAFADALYVRPAVMFGPDDAFLTTILKLLASFQSIRCSAAAAPDCSRPMWKMLRKRSPESYGEPKRIRQSSSSAVLASTLTNNCSESLRTKLASRPY
jgi:NADH dehydrogenase